MDDSPLSIGAYYAWNVPFLGNVVVLVRGNGLNTHISLGLASLAPRRSRWRCLVWPRALASDTSPDYHHQMSIAVPLVS